MSLCTTGGRSLVKSILRGPETFAIIDVPLFLCPALRLSNGSFQPLSLGSSERRHRYGQRHERRGLHIQSQAERALGEEQHGSLCKPNSTVARLPSQCAGCGALSQSFDNSEPGFYAMTRRTVKDFLEIRVGHSGSQKKAEQLAFEESLKNVDSELLESLHLDSKTSKKATLKPKDPPVCDRCHKLLHHQTGTSISHPTIHSIQDTIYESPHKYNHVYHVIDAADFPMSLIPSLHKLLHLTPQRSMNRRSKTGRFYHGRKTEVSFIITRSDLLAPLKAQVDSLMPYLTDVLRDALGSMGKDVRLGNVRCVSSKRGWWTKELKEDIYHRGGGGWMVGKVNVGKSELFGSVFPKGRRGTAKVQSSSQPTSSSVYSSSDLSSDLQELKAEGEENEYDFRDDKAQTSPLDTGLLLPPSQPESDYPAMPLVSSLPGTTASPIRVSFGSGRGELIDLPGLSRGDLELHVQEPHRQSLVMRSRVTPEQVVMKPGQSLLLGGFIRITPTTPDLIFMAYAFTPLNAHLTSTEKAIAIQNQDSESHVENIAVEGTGVKTKSAGVFKLEWDVTRKRTGPITAPSAAGIKPERLPYQVVSTDILISGVGWVELVAQVRKKTLETTSYRPLDGLENYSRGDGGYTTSQPQWPEVEVFTPEGQFISQRRPMSAWSMGGEKKSKESKRGRPRPSMKGAKKRAKIVARAITSV